MSDTRAGRACDAALLLVALALPLSIAVTEIALGLAIVAWLATRPWSRPGPPFGRVLGAATLALAATWILASVTAEDPVASLIKARKLYSIVLVFIVADRMRDPARAARLAAVALLGAGVSSGIGLVGFAVEKLVQAISYVRLESVFSNAMTSGNVFATLAIATIGEFFIRSGNRRARLALGAVAVSLSTALLGTLTRSSWLAFLAGAGLLLARLRPRLLLGLAALVAVVLAVGPQQLRERAATVFDPHHESYAGRISLWQSGAQAFADHPWTGVGLADHYALVERYRRPDATFHAGHFHDNFVQIAVSTGSLGLLAYLAWMGIVAWLLVRGAARPGAGRALVGLAVWLGFQVHGLFDWSFGDAEVVNQFFLWVGLGLAAAAGRPADDPVRPPSSSLSTST